MFHVKHRKGKHVYTLERVLYLVDDGSDIYCKIYKSDRYVAEGWLTDMDLDSDTKIESYRLDYDCYGEEYLVLHLA
jgi:hypothetical protein